MTTRPHRFQRIPCLGLRRRLLAVGADRTIVMAGGCAETPRRAAAPS
jgi:hypothetical protein